MKNEGILRGKRVIITGASSGIGRCLAERMLAEGAVVYGIGRRFTDTDERMKKIEFDLTDSLGISGMITRILKEGDVDILVNNAGCAYYGTHETLTPEMIHEMVSVNLEAPMIITGLVLKRMKTVGGGRIINISSVTADRINTHGCAYGATKSGLASFGKSLFDEARKCGIKVTTIKPDMTDTSLYRNASFKASGEDESSLYPRDVADAIMQVLEYRDGMNVSEVIISPQKHRIVKC